MCFLQRVFWRGKMPLVCTRCHCVITEHLKLEGTRQIHPVKIPSDETMNWSREELQSPHLQFVLHLSHLVGFVAIFLWKTSSLRDLLFLCRAFSLHTVFLFGVWLCFQFLHLKRSRKTIDVPLWGSELGWWYLPQEFEVTRALEFCCSWKIKSRSCCWWQHTFQILLCGCRSAAESSGLLLLHSGTIKILIDEFCTGCKVLKSPCAPVGSEYSTCSFSA